MISDHRVDSSWKGKSLAREGAFVEDSGEEAIEPPSGERDARFPKKESAKWLVDRTLKSPAKSPTRSLLRGEKVIGKNRPRIQGTKGTRYPRGRVIFLGLDGKRETSRKQHDWCPGGFSSGWRRAFKDFTPERSGSSPREKKSGWFCLNTV